MPTTIFSHHRSNGCSWGEVTGGTANPGQFTYLWIPPALTVNIAIGGTASSSANCSTIPTTVTFAAGSTTALVNLNVIDDTLIEGTETAILTIRNRNELYVGSANNCHVNIADNGFLIITVAATDANAGEITGEAQQTRSKVYPIPARVATST
ncbi:hypothetical protein U9R62_07885 [Cylindrospermopsis raciborskii DSH]|uniref:hypothetical protein n=1 Tax=Cylindrospermopsis raciborskii TaxID=77022 RepID=UPI002ED77513